MKEFKQYQRKQIAELRPYIDGEMLSSTVSISDADRKGGSPKEGDMIARNPKDHNDQWLVAEQYFKDNFGEVDRPTNAEIEDVVSRVWLTESVYPSGKLSIATRDDDEYGGAHIYEFRNSTGFNNGEATYVNSFQRINFVKKESDGSMTPGIQSEQLLIALIDRHKKLNDKYPSREGALAITKMQEALHWLETRVKERIQRGVMGQLKK